MKVEPNDWRPYGKIIYQKQNFIVKQVALLHEKAVEYDSDLITLAVRFNLGSIRIYINYLMTGANSLPDHRGIIVSVNVYHASVIDTITFRTTYLAGLKHSTFMKSLEDNLYNGWESARIIAHDTVTKATKSKNLKEICKAIGYPPFIIAALGKALLKFEDGDALPLIAKFYEELITGILYMPVDKLDELALRISDKTWEVIDSTEFNY